MCSLALLCLAVTSSAGAADVPQLINVQGKLTDAVGDPVADGPHSVTFSIYDVASGGTALWSEPRTVQTTDGLFNILLGESVDFPASLFDDTLLWLGMKVGTDPEMTPRQRLTTAPYSFRSSGAAVGGGWADDGNIVRLETSTDSVGIGTASPSARLHVVESNGTAVQAFSNGGTGAAAGLYAYSDTWHAVLGINSNSNAAIMGRNDGSGPGIKGQNQGTGPAITGYASSGNLLELYNTPGPNLRFSISNDGYVQADSTIESTSGGFKFPDGTVQTTAATDEPGIAQGIVKSTLVDVAGELSMIDIVTVTISIPAPGYVVVEASGQANFGGTISPNYMACQIDSTAGGSNDLDYYHMVGFSTPPNVDVIWLPISMRRTYYESSAGSHTYRFEAMDKTGYGAKYIWNPVITATYFPTSYGSVLTVASSSDVGQFERAELRVPGPNGLQEVPTGEGGYVVDLRELELKAARLRDELRKIEAEIAEEELQKQAENLNQNK